MSFISRLLNRPVVLDLYTARKDIFEFSPPVKAAKTYPEWWLKLPKAEPRGSMLGSSRTMKNCVGFTNLFKHGLVIPMWSDIEISVGPVGSDFMQLQYADGKSEAGVHPESQRGTYLPDSLYQHVKLTSPWRAKCSDDIEWAFVQPVWNFEHPDKIIIPAGVTEFTHQSATNINLFIPRTEQTSVLSIPHGQPMAHLIPLTDRPVEYRVHLTTQEKFDEMALPRLWFMDAYRKSKKHKQSCPMRGAK